MKKILGKERKEREKEVMIIRRIKSKIEIIIEGM